MYRIYDSVLFIVLTISQIQSIILFYLIIQNKALQFKLHSILLNKKQIVKI